MNHVDDAIMRLYAANDREMERIPPISAALREHTKRTVFQGNGIWGQMLTLMMDFPSPCEWGWHRPTSWKPFWTVLPEASALYKELLKCGCKKDATGPANAKSSPEMHCFVYV